MKTARSIEEQEERKQTRDNEGISPELRPPVRPKSKQRDATRIAAWRFKPGQSGNPGGKPKHDVAKEIAQAIFLNNAEMIYKAYSKMLGRGNAYAFQVLADRAFGKLKETYEEIHPYKNVSEEDMLKRIAEAEQKLQKLGWTVSGPQSESFDESSDSKPN